MPLCLFEFVSLLVELLLESVSGTAMARSLQGCRALASLLLAMERRLIAFTKAQDKAS
jgi:hypothetical protein